MPGDVTGSLVFDNATSEFTFREGPVFTNMLLADEINRTPPKTQASLLEAMEEHQVSIDGVPRKLPSPFVVAATQNPVEYEGTYRCPRLSSTASCLKVTLPLPPREDEIAILGRHAAGFDPRNLAGAGMVPVATPTTSPPVSPRGQARRDRSGGARLHHRRHPRATRMSPSLSLGVSPRR